MLKRLIPPSLISFEIDSTVPRLVIEQLRVTFVPSSNYFVSVL